jgi:hypothetical protein
MTKKYLTATQLLLFRRFVRFFKVALGLVALVLEIIKRINDLLR